MSDNKPCHRTLWAIRRAWEQQADIRINRAIKEQTGGPNKALARRLKYELLQIVTSLEERDMPPVDDGKVGYRY